MFTQHLLRVELARRIRLAHGVPSQMSDVDLAELSDQAMATQPTTGVAAIAVLRRFDPGVFVRSAVEFAFGVDSTRRDAWLAAYTRTLFLAGSPANLAHRFAWDHVSEDGSIAWLGPVALDRSVGLRRLLKRFDGARPPQPPPVVPVDLPGDGRGAAHRLQVALRGLSTAEYLVHVNHVLAESVLTGIIRPGDRLTLDHVPRLSTAPGPYSALRVHRDNADPDRLRAYAVLTPEPITPEGESPA